MLHLRLALIAAGLLLASAAPATSAEDRATPTFSRDIAPIVQSYCAPCHRPGEAAPFSLLSYDDVKKHGGQIVTVTKSRYMPPWLPEPGYGAFEGERRLSDRQVELIRRWVMQGAPKGDRASLPAKPTFVEGWQLGQPDLVLELPQPYTLPPGGMDIYRNFIFPVPVATPRYVRALEIRPGNPKAVHHANVLIDREQSSRNLDRHDGSIGFPGMDLKITSNTFDPDGYFLFWKPGTTPYVDPEGMAWRIDNKTDLVLNMHLQPSGKPEAIRPSIGLYFTDKEPVHHPMLLQLENDQALDIPPGESDFHVADDFTLPVDVDVLGVYPHAHYLGKDLRAYATPPGGKRQEMIWIKRWDQNWQAVYRYAKPMFLPKGTTISMRYTYDNSVANLFNPSQPPRRVTAGNQATDEMAHLWVQVLPRDETNDRSRLALQEELARVKLRKDPADFSANYNLGAVLSLQDKFEDAIPFLNRALESAPTDAAAHNTLGAVLRGSGRLDEAIRQFQEAVNLRPDYPDARYNLADALLAAGNLNDGVVEFRTLVQANPQDVAAKGKLSAALQQLGTQLASKRRLPEALAMMEEARTITPDDADLLTNIGAALASMGRYQEAEAEFVRALQLAPDHEVARRNLALVKKSLGK